MSIYQKIICIDGAAATGKTTAATTLAKELRYAMFDSGSLYRAFSYYLLREDIPLDPEKMVQALEGFQPVITPKGEIRINKRSIMRYLRTEEVTDVVPFVANQACIRERMRSIQRAFAQRQKGKVIFTGRDTGDEVFPESQYKFYFVANAEVRAQRRLPEMRKKNRKLTYEAVLAQLKARDHKDETRVNSPMRKPEDAHVIDTSNKEPDETIAEIKRVIAEKQTTIEGQRRRSKELV